MPTHDEEAQFLREWAKLSSQQRSLFLAAVDAMVEDLRNKIPFRPSLRVKAVQKRRGVFEVTWAPDGRATFHYGPSRRSGEAHIVWRRIGGHDILKNP